MMSKVFISMFLSIILQSSISLSQKPDFKIILHFDEAEENQELEDKFTKSENELGITNKQQFGGCFPLSTETRGQIQSVLRKCDRGMICLHGICIVQQQCGYNAGECEEGLRCQQGFCIVDVENRRKEGKHCDDNGSKCEEWLICEYEYTAYGGVCRKPRVKEGGICGYPETGECQEGFDCYNRICKKIVVNRQKEGKHCDDMGIECEEWLICEYTSHVGVCRKPNKGVKEGWHCGYPYSGECQEGLDCYNRICKKIVENRQKEGKHCDDMGIECEEWLICEYTTHGGVCRKPRVKEEGPCGYAYTGECQEGLDCVKRICKKIVENRRKEGQDCDDMGSEDMGCEEWLTCEYTTYGRICRKKLAKRQKEGETCDDNGSKCEEWLNCEYTHYGRICRKETLLKLGYGCFPCDGSRSSCPMTCEEGLSCVRTKFPVHFAPEGGTCEKDICGTNWRNPCFACSRQECHQVQLQPGSGESCAWDNGVCAYGITE